MALSESSLQMRLAADPFWLQRLTYTMLQVALEVKAEGLRTPFHVERSRYASTVISNSAMAAQQASGLVVGGPNIVGTADITDNGIVTTATDEAIHAQVTSYWNVLSGVDTGPA